MAKVVTESFRIESTDEFVQSFANDAGNNYYIMGSSVDEDDTITNTQKSIREFQRKVVFGNKISSDDVKYMFARNNWASGTVYDAFDDQSDMSDKNFYVTVLGGNGQINESSYNVFKCIRNNSGAPSTESPSEGVTQSGYEVTLDDGYVWKYMFDVPPAQYALFGTSKFLPYIPKQQTIDTAIQGISDVVIESVDESIFVSYLVGDDENPTQSLISGVTKVAEGTDDVLPKWEFRLTCNRIVKSTRGAYQNMYLRDPSGTVSEMVFDIIDSFVPVDVDATQNKTLIVQVYSDSDLSVLSEKFCQIVPKIEISQPDSVSGTQAIAYGTLNALGTLNNTAFKSKGSGYTFATAVLKAPPSAEFGVTSIRPIISPKGGHGANPVHELFMSRVATVTSFISDVNTTIPDSNSYTKVGLVKNPTFIDSTTGVAVSSPSDFDNRVKIIIDSTELLPTQASVGFYVEQTVGTQTVSGIVHEVKFVNNATELYVIDTVGGGNAKFEQQAGAGTGTFIIKTSESSPATSYEGIINTIHQNTYVPYSGDVLHFVDFDPITRTETSKEKVKLIFDF